MKRYIKPIFNRTALDVANKTAKGYFNVNPDWLRVYNNAEMMSTLASIVEEPIVFNIVTEPTISTNPQTYLTKLNTLLANIERVRTAVAYHAIPDVVEIKDDWQSGKSVASPKHTDVNLWEKVIDAIFQNIGEASGYTNWIPDSATPVRRHRCAVATCGAGLTQNNGFVKYD